MGEDITVVPRSSSICTLWEVGDKDATVVSLFHEVASTYVSTALKGSFFEDDGAVLRCSAYDFMYQNDAWQRPRSPPSSICPPTTGESELRITHPTYMNIREKKVDGRCYVGTRSACKRRWPA